MSSKTPTTVSDWLAFDDTRTAYMAASPKQKAEVVRYLGGVLALLRAQALSYQTSHWQVRGDDYYGNHLMFERLYGSVGEEIDTLAEKIVGYVGVEGVALPDQMEKIHMLCGAWGRIECHHRRGIQSETDLQKALKIAYDSIKESGLMTLGLDDFLMATASSHESNQYLLQQALAARPKSAASPRKSSIRRKAAVPKKYEHIDFKPPKGVADAAAKGLELRQKASPSNRGGLTSEEAGKQGIGSGVQRAVNLKNRDTVSPKVIKQMHGFLSRAEGYSEIADDNKSTPWNDKGYVAWLLWGGDPAKSWVDKIIGQMEAADEKEKAKKAHLIVTASENEPTNPDLWAKVQALAKGEQASMTHGGKTINGPNDGKGFTVFPSAYANGWASKVYKDLGGGWKKKAGGA